MPRLVNQRPKYRKHRASGQAIVTLAGRDFYLGPWKSAASRAEYDRLTGEYLAGGGMLPTDDGLTVVELLAAFKRHAKGYYGPKAREYATYCTLAKQLAAKYGRTPAREFGPLRLKAFRQSLVDAGLARRTVNHQTSRVRLVFSWGVENELIPGSVVEALRCVKGLRYGRSGAKETEPVKPVADCLVDATLPHLAPQVRAMVELQRTTGMRSGEVCIMRTGDINTSGNVWTYTPAQHKNAHRGHSRIVYLGSKAQDILRPWLRNNLNEYLFQPAEAEQWRREQRHAARKTPIGYGNRPGTNRVKGRKKLRKAGASYTSGSYGRAIAYGCELAFGMPAELRREPRIQAAEQKTARLQAAAAWRNKHCWNPHQLRHRFATDARRQFDLETARILCGHKHASVTEIYADANHDRAVEAMAKIG